jgi:hypothetical protein
LSKHVRKEKFIWLTNPKDPLEGVHFTNYDPPTEFVTIEIHPSILADPRQFDAVVKKAIEIIEGGPNVKGVHVEPRKK